MDSTDKSTKPSELNPQKTTVVECRTWQDLPVLRDLMVDKEYRVRVGAFGEETTYVQLESTEDVISKIMTECDRLGAAGEKHLSKLEELMVGGLYLTKYVDDHWYRGVVTKLSAKAADILYIDYGNAETFEELGTAVLLYDPGFMLIPPLSVPVKVVDVDGKTSLNTISDLVSDACAEGQYVTMKVLKKVAQDSPLGDEMPIRFAYEISLTLQKPAKDKMSPVSLASKEIGEQWEDWDVVDQAKEPERTTVSAHEVKNETVASSAVIEGEPLPHVDQADEKFEPISVKGKEALPTCEVKNSLSTVASSVAIEGEPLPRVDQADEKFERISEKGKEAHPTCEVKNSLSTVASSVAIEGEPLPREDQADEKFESISEKGKEALPACEVKNSLITVASSVVIEGEPIPREDQADEKLESISEKGKEALPACEVKNSLSTVASSVVIEGEPLPLEDQADEKFESISEKGKEALPTCEARNNSYSTDSSSNAASLLKFEVEPLPQVLQCGHSHFSIDYSKISNPASWDNQFFIQVLCSSLQSKDELIGLMRKDYTAQLEKMKNRIEELEKQAAA